MKKLRSFLLWAVIAGVLSYSFIYAEDLTESTLKNLFEWTDFLFGYDADHKVTVDSMSNNSITLSSPVLKSELWDKIEDYIVLYGTHSFNDLASDLALLSSYTEVSFSPQDKTASDFTMTLDSNLGTNSIYYLVVIPRDNWEELWSMSNEICFKLKDKISWEWDECANWVASTATTHTSSSRKSAISLANVSCTWNGKQVTVSRVPTSDIWNIKISLYNESTNNFDIKGTVNATNERTFTFNVNQSTAPIVRFDDTEWLSAYKTYTCHKLDTNTPTTTPTTTPTKVTTVPTVGPKENIIAIIAWALVLYVFYRVVRRKAD